MADCTFYRAFAVTIGRYHGGCRGIDSSYGAKRCQRLNLVANSHSSIKDVVRNAFLHIATVEGFLQYAVAPLIGVPLIMLFNMRGMDPIIALSAMAVMWPIGDCFPYRYCGPRHCYRADYKGRYYGDFVKACLIPWICSFNRYFISYF